MKGIEIYGPPASAGEKVLTNQCYTIEDIELVLDVSRPTVMKLLSMKEFRWIKVGNVYRISRNSFDEWLQERL